MASQISGRRSVESRVSFVTIIDLGTVRKLSNDAAHDSGMPSLTSSAREEKRCGIC